MVLFCRPQDYPSVYQLGELARTSETNIVFAVTSEGANPNALRDVYQVTYYKYYVHSSFMLYQTQIHTSFST